MTDEEQKAAEETAQHLVLAKDILPDVLTIIPFSQGPYFRAYGSACPHGEEKINNARDTEVGAQNRGGGPHQASRHRGTCSLKGSL
jgi:hypothetical protein